MDTTGATGTGSVIIGIGLAVALTIATQARIITYEIPGGAARNAHGIDAAAGDVVVYCHWQTGHAPSQPVCSALTRGPGGRMSVAPYSLSSEPWKS